MAVQVVPTPGRFPKGPDIALRWPKGFELSYWDLWFLITCKDKFAFDYSALESFFLAHLKRDTKTSNSDDWYMRLAHWHDLIKRVGPSQKAGALLQDCPEKLIKKETKKGIERVTSASFSDECSEPMLKNRRYLLRREVHFGLWTQFPVDPTEYYERNKTVFWLPRNGYVDLDASFELSDDIDKVYSKQKKTAANDAERLAVSRAFISLMMRNAKFWNDSCGELSGSFREIYEDWLETDLRKARITSEIFYLDLLRVHVFDDYCLCYAGQRKLASRLSLLDPNTKEMIRGLMGSFAKTLEEVYEWYFIDQLNRFELSLNGIVGRY